MSSNSNIDDLEMIFSEIKEPKINLTSRIMNEIGNKTEKENNRVRYNKLTSGVLVIALVVFSGFAIRAANPGIYIIDSINNLMTGEGKYIKIYNDERKVEEAIYISKPFVEKDIEAFKLAAKNNYLSIGALPIGFQFEEANFGYKSSEQKNNVEYPGDISDYSTVYKLDDKKIDLRVRIGSHNTRFSLFNSDVEQKTYSEVKEIQINGHQGFIKTYNYGDKHGVFENGIETVVDLGGYKYITWIYQNFLLKLTFSENINLSETDMIQIAESIK
jgi:hypothetical protein